MTVLDAWIVCVITFLGLLSRIIFLDRPPWPTAKEEYYSSLLNHNGRNEFFIDKNPPLALILLLISSCILSCKGESSSEDSIYYLHLRFSNCCLAGLVPVISYLCLRGLRLGRNTAITTSLMVICETSFISEARLISIDANHQFFMMMTILCLTLNGSFTYRSMKWWSSILFSGFSFGCLLSTTLNSISFLPFIIFFQWHVARKQLSKSDLPGAQNNKIPWKRIVVITLPIIAISILTLCFFLSLHAAMISNKQSVHQIVASMLKGEGFEKDVNYATNLWTLPLGLTKVYPIWQGDRVKCATHVNFFNCILGSVSVVACFTLWITSKPLDKTTKSRIAKVLPFAIGYLSCYANLIVSQKPVYASDYSSCLLFGIFCFGSFIEFVLKETGFIQGVIATFSQFLVVFGFILWCPWVYGISGPRKETTVWFHSWE